MSGKIIAAALAATVLLGASLLGASVLASAEPKSDMRKGANAAHPMLHYC